jgi:hypothetical protein
MPKVEYLFFCSELKRAPKCMVEVIQQCKNPSAAQVLISSVLKKIERIPQCKSTNKVEPNGSSKLLYLWLIVLIPLLALGVFCYRRRCR